MDTTINEMHIIFLLKPPGMCPECTLTCPADVCEKLQEALGDISIEHDGFWQHCEVSRMLLFTGRRAAWMCPAQLQGP